MKNKNFYHCPTCGQRVPNIDEDDFCSMENEGERKFLLYLRHKKGRLVACEKYLKEAREQIWGRKEGLRSAEFNLLISLEIIHDILLKDVKKKILLENKS